MDKVKIISLHKTCNKAGAKVEIKRGAKAKAGSKTGAKATSKAPRSGYHLFLREQLGKMKGEDRKNYCSIVSRRWEEIKEDPARLSACNDRARQMKNETEEPAKAGDDLSVGSMEQQTVTGRPVCKKKTDITSKCTKNPRVY